MLHAKKRVIDICQDRHIERELKNKNVYYDFKRIVIQTIL